MAEAHAVLNVLCSGRESNWLVGLSLSMALVRTQVSYSSIQGPNAGVTLHNA